MLDLSRVLNQVDSFALAQVLRLDDKCLSFCGGFFRRRFFFCRVFFELKLELVVLNGQDVSSREEIVLVRVQFVHAHQAHGQLLLVRDA